VKKALLLALAVLAAALVIPTAFAGNGPANMATGDLWFNNNVGPAHWVFDAHDLGQTGDKGSVFYQDANGSYTATVTNAVVGNATSATFTAMVTSSTYLYAHVGDTFTWTVYDNGEGSSGTGDYFTYDGAVLGGVTYPGTDGLHYPITAGNIQVHFKA
jgi:hypothetical protein